MDVKHTILPNGIPHTELTGEATSEELAAFFSETLPDLLKARAAELGIELPGREVRAPEVQFRPPADHQPTHAGG
jgi:hypothetical protein